MNDRPIDVIIYGATGFTGALVAKEVAKHPLPNMKWSLAGRDLKRLESVKSTLDFGKYPPSCDVVDVKDEEALKKLFEKAKVVINCVGPFRFYGIPVVKACVESGTSYVDVTGEPEFIIQSMVKFSELAKKNNSTIVHTCGFDSVPADLGVLQQRLEFERRKAIPDSIEMFHTFDWGPAGVRGNYATYESAVEGFGHVQELKKWRRELAQQLPDLKFDKKYRLRQGLFEWDKDLKRYLFVFPGADSAVVRLSQRLMKNGDSSLKRLPPVQFGGYVAVQTFFWTLIMIILGMIIFPLTQYEWGRRFMKNHPVLFSAGRFQKDVSPTPEQLAQTSFCTYFVGKGKDVDGNKVVIKSKCHGPEPGYVATPILVRECAYTLVKEKSKCPSGVLLPQAAFGETDIIDRLTKSGVKFELMN